MATLIDNAGTQHYANKMVLAENRRVGSKPLPTALNDIDIALDEMKVLFEEEYGSVLDMKLENSENIFSVGTGNGIDKRSEVENSFTDVEVYGNSMVNLIVAKNITLDATSDKTRTKAVECTMIKPSTIYTFIVHAQSNTADTPLRMTKTPTFPFVSHNIAEKGKTGVFVTKLTSATSFSVNQISFNVNQGTGSISFSCIVLEGDYTNKSIPSYFEGLKSVGEKEDRNEIEVLSAGKNFLKPKTLTTSTYPFFIKKGEVLTLSTKDGVPSSGGNVELKDINGVTQWFAIDAGLTSVTRTVPKDIYGIKNSLNGTMEYQLEYGSKNTQFESYKATKKQILLNEPLRGLPNGIKDSIEKINGEWKIVRRCGEALLDNSLQWRLNNTENTHLNTNRFITTLPINNNPVAPYPFIGISDKLPVYSDWSDTAHFGVTFGNPKTVFVYKKDCTTAEEFTEWITNNPTKVIYKLETPIIEDIDEITLQCWKNGTISIDEILPVETTHTVALNKPAQIKRNIEELTSLRGRVLALEEQYDQIALEQAHKLELLNHSFELDYNI